jgi:hypothetical protein
MDSVVGGKRSSNPKYSNEFRKWTAYVKCLWCRASYTANWPTRASGTDIDTDDIRCHFAVLYKRNVRREFRLPFV